jgi:type 1 fimbriae regulatory protein FimB/type 1 fimbriae regulatory protein FimE
MIERVAEAAELGIKAHAHMLRHACSFKLANDGGDTPSLQAYRGHRNVQNTTRYTALTLDRFKGFCGTNKPE